MSLPYHQGNTPISYPDTKTKQSSSSLFASQNTNLCFSMRWQVEKMMWCHFAILQFCNFAILQFCNFAILQFCNFRSAQPMLKNFYECSLQLQRDMLMRSPLPDLHASCWPLPLYQKTALILSVCFIEHKFVFFDEIAS